VVSVVEAASVEPSSSIPRTWLPAPADSAAPATNSVENVSAIAARRRRERGFVVAGSAGAGATSSSPRPSSHSSQARPWRSLVKREFRGIALSLRFGFERRGRHFGADLNF
jgi:hypothetical protein